LAGISSEATDYHAAFRGCEIAKIGQEAEAEKILHAIGRAEASES
jgi:hypothetical protein